MRAALERHGRVDVLVNNAGQGLHLPLEEVGLDDLRAITELNVYAPLVAMQAFVAPVLLHMVSRHLVDDYDLTAVPVDEAIDEFTAAWLRAMTPPRRRR